MARWRITPLGGSHAAAAALTRSVIEGHTLAAALAAAGMIHGGTVKTAERGTLARVDYWPEGFAEPVAVLAAVDRVPDAPARNTGVERHPAQDRGGSSRKRQIRQPFTPQPGSGAPALVGSDGKRRAAVMPKSGAYCTRQDRKAAHFDLDRAGLGTLAGASGGTVNRAPIHGPTAGNGGRGYRAEADRPIPFAILDARVTARSDSDPRTGKPGGGERVQPTVKQRRHTLARKRLAS